MARPWLGGEAAAGWWGGGWVSMRIYSGIRYFYKYFTHLYPQHRYLTEVFEYTHSIWILIFTLFLDVCLIKYLYTLICIIYDIYVKISVDIEV